MGDSNDITQRVDRICESIRELLLALAVPPEQEINEEAEDIRRALEVIRAKEFISVPEAAQLASCSDSHLHNQIQAAIDGTAVHPIPFVDLDGTGGGVKRLHREKFLEWAALHKSKRQPKVRGKKKGKTALVSGVQGRGLRARGSLDQSCQGWHD